MLDQSFGRAWMSLCRTMSQFPPQNLGCYRLPNPPAGQIAADPSNTARLIKQSIIKYWAFEWAECIPRKEKAGTLCLVK